MSKLNENTMREQYDGQYKTFCKKNSDYGNSFEESLDKHGIVASIVRMGDKMNRLESLTDASRTRQVCSESLLDTLEDLSNYAAMTACWLKGVRAEDGKEEVIGSVYVFGQDEPYATFKQKKHPYKNKVSGPDTVDVMRYAAEDMMNDPVIQKRLKEEIISNSMESMESNANSITVKQDVEIRLFSKEINSVMDLLVQNVLDQRSPANDLDNKLRQAHDRNMAYKKIACLIIITPWLSFDGFSNYVDTFRDLMADEKQLIKEGVATEIYCQTDKNPGGDEESEFRSKKFNIPTEETKTENLTFKPQKEDKEEKEPLNEKMFKAILWLFHPIIDKDYRGDDNE